MENTTEFKTLQGKEALLHAIRNDSSMVSYVEIEIPKSVEVSVDEKKVVVEGKNGRIVKDFSYMRAVDILQDGDKIYVARRLKKPKDKHPVRTVASKIRNVISGVQKLYIMHHKVIFKHFPIRVYSEEGNIVLDNFYGRRDKIKVPIRGENTEVEVKMEEDSNIPSDVLIKGPDKEAVTQTSASLKETCKLKGKQRKDVRVFQDGVWPWRLERE